jgi:uncharacterized protein
MPWSHKLKTLRTQLKNLDGIAIAFSGGVDSTFLVAVAKEELGDKVLAVTATSPTYPQHEQNEAVELAAWLKVKHILVDSNELEIPNFAENPVNRCYYCKSELFSIVRKIAAEHGINAIADGTNADDLSDHRPGREAACEQSVLSPLMEAGLTKNEIRLISKKMGLPTAEKPQFACLASRFPYGSRITAEKLKSIDMMEILIRKLGFGLVRVRHHGDIARIEVEPDKIEKLCSEDIRKKILRIAQEAGFLYVTVDLKGYRTGSMNEGLTPKEIAKSK